MFKHIARSHARKSGFSLVEMLVVIAIIALLLAALLPAFGVVRNKARETATRAQFAAFDTGIASYRAEQALGGGLPPSSSDWPLASNNQADRVRITNPLKDDANEISVSGAHLLVHAMIGADGLGTPGFKDTNRDANRTWSDDTNKREAEDKTAGLYYIDDEGTPRHARYGGAGYVDEKMREKTSTLKEMVDEGNAVAIPPDLENSTEQSFFVDAWGHPILYYRANPTATRMTGSSAGAGVYWQEDNAIFTGSENGLIDAEGIDFGAGKDVHGSLHWIHNAESPPAAGATSLVDEIAETNDEYEHSFARFIIDRSIKARPTPVQRSEYLLISAGPDGIYGSDDDVTNWTRKTE